MAQATTLRELQSLYDAGTKQTSVGIKTKRARRATFLRRQPQLEKMEKMASQRK